MTNNQTTELKPCTQYDHYNTNCEAMMTLYPCDNCLDNMIKECNKNMSLWWRFREYIGYLRFKFSVKKVGSNDK